MAHHPVQMSGLSVDEAFHRFIEEEALPGSGIGSDAFWSGLAELVDRFAGRNRALLAERERLQQAIDTWHRERRGQAHDAAAYRTLLEDLGYLLPEAVDATLATVVADPELSSVAGPQLVVPVKNARYALNAANARWGSLYDALYGTDALGDAPSSNDYDHRRGARVIAWARGFLDDIAPLVDASHRDAQGYQVVDGALQVVTATGRTGLADPTGFVGFEGTPTDPRAIWLLHNGLHVVLRIDRSHPVGSDDAAGISDVEVEAATTVIMDCEDSVAAVDAEDKIEVYRNWLGLLRRTLTTEVAKDGRSVVRELAPPRSYTSVAGDTVTVRGNGLLLVRNVGLLMRTSIVRDADGEPVPEELLDVVLSGLGACHDRAQPPHLRNSRDGSVYVVKPKLHGPEEVAYTDQVCAAVEDAFGLQRATIKLGLMDEERRTTLNLAGCLAAARERVVFINTGFLDRTGDEIHTSMEAGPMLRKGEMKDATWLGAYEDANVDVGLRAGLPGRGQIGKGMWAAPDRMAAMLEEKIAHPRAGANCAWVPSPTAATLHATHYHAVDVASRQRELAGRAPRTRDELLAIPVAADPSWSAQERREELENNLQGILGYVARWVSQGVGCSKVPDIHGVALMEDRATCRISAQHVANWLHHGIVTEDEVETALRRMAQVVDEQNADDGSHVSLAPDFDAAAFRAAHDLVFRGREQPSGYTEPILHARRAEHKAHAG